MLKEAHSEKSRLVESKVRQIWASEAEAMGPQCCLLLAKGLHFIPSHFTHIIVVAFP